MGLPARRIQQQFSLVGSLYRLVDAASVAGGLALAVWGTGGSHAEYLLPGAAAIIVHYLVAELVGMYRSWRGVAGDREAFAAIATWSLAFALLAGLGYATGRLQSLPRLPLGLWLLATPLFMIVSHGILRALQKSLWLRGLNTKACAIVGVTDLGIQLARNIFDAPELGLKLAGYYDDRPPERGPQLPPGLKDRIGGIDDLVADAKAGFIDRIYITFPMRAEERIRGVLAKLSDTTASVYIVPDFFVFQLLHSRWTDIGGLPAVSVFENPLYGVDGLVKRAFDLVVASLGLVAISPLLLATALAIKLTSRGPVFFRQRRYGLDGREILVWKFRSMTVCEDGAKVTQATKTDSRVTPLGAILRRTSIDELPQLFNVIGGTMSLVGPRPHAAAHNEQYRKMIEGYMLRHKVKPGITGLAQVRGWRGETDTLEKMQRRIDCDHEYIREWSLWLDVKILFRTIFVVLKRQNAY
ncbi:MAG: undecaprenyl-phosphate glucose phosphotransferase [Pirellulaceae bacterium]|nr:undecaprenyl-phosphate glucose phosphotransferase [Pirellulaceae bacterium]